MNFAHGSYFSDNLDQALQDFKDCGWETVYDAHSSDDYNTIAEKFYESAKQAEDAGNPAHGRVFWLLGEACSMRLALDRFTNPFDPVLLSGGKGSTIAADFTDSEIEYLTELIGTIDRPFLKARLADLVWDGRTPRDVKFALAAIDSYMKLPLQADTRFNGREQCWRRAINLCRMIGAKAGDRLNQIESSFVKVLNSSTTGDKFFSIHIADTLRNNGLGADQASVVAVKLESLGLDFNAEADFHAAGRFYNAAAKWFGDAGDNAKFTDMTVAEAEALVSEADARLASDHPSYGVAASFLENAVQVYRSIPRTCRDLHQVDERIGDLQLRVSEYGKLALDELATVSGPATDLSDLVEHARDAVNGKSVDQALRSFVSLHSVDVKKMRKSAEKDLARFPLLSLIPKVITSHDGRVVSRTTGISPSNPSNSDESEILAQMQRFHYQPLVVAAVRGLILPALQVLRMEHRITEGDFIAGQSHLIERVPSADSRGPIPPSCAWRQCLLAECSHA